MTQISFSVSARMARLIGQENFTNAEGAIVELVKNAYDADSKVCLVIYDLPYIDFKDTFTKESLSIIQHNAPDLYNLLSFENNSLQLTAAASKEYYSSIKNILWAEHAIYIIDNGHGMDDSNIKKNWMTIGTGNKEIDFRTGDGRIKTGAKGIGRFALDRLGSGSEMWTKPVNEVKGFYWKMNWNQFEVPNLSLEDIKADLENPEVDLYKFIKDKFSSFPFFSKLEASNFKNGTIIKISRLRDEWTTSHLETSFKNLEALIPPKDLQIPFKVYQGYLQSPEVYGEVETAFFNDFDYKITATFDTLTQEVNYTITRNELDTKLIDHNFTSLYKDVTYPYDLNTIKEKSFSITRNIYELMKWKKNDENFKLFKDIGDFSFHLYFFKNVNSSKESYPYKQFSIAERQKVLSRFGGIKIYRDSFRVRPYGDPGNDWLGLGERAQRSPAGPGQRIGDWKVGPNQVAGLINISRIDNPKLIDKSDRGALVENLTFDLFKKIVINIISEFEYDRSKILNPYYKYQEAQKKKKKDEEIQATAKKIADEMYANRIKKERNTKQGEKDTEDDPINEDDLLTEKAEFQRELAENLLKIEDSDEKDAELAQVRSLASLGLIVSSFAHELKEIRNNVTELKDLERIYQKFKNGNSVSEITYKDGQDILDLLKIDGEKIKHWVDYSLTAIKKDRRKRRAFNFSDYFLFLEKAWDVPLKNRNITFEIANDEISDYQFRAFEIDMDTIFSNLITNSIDALNNMDVVGDRKISIYHYLSDNRISVIYTDNGTGIPDVFRNKDEIFLPFTTSKKDRDGNDVGTGLGMYLVKMVVEDNNADIKILTPENGFSVQIDFPIRNI